MKIVGCAIAIVASAVVFTPTIVGAADFSGTWVVNGTIGTPAMAQVSPVCVLKQDGKGIRGSCKGPHGIGPAQGKVDGEKIVWHWDDEATDKNGYTGTSTFSGILGSDGVVKGTWTSTAVPNESGTFTMQKVE